MVKKDWTPQHIKNVAQYMINEVGAVNGWDDNVAEDMYDAIDNYQSRYNLLSYNSGTTYRKIINAYSKMVDNTRKKINKNGFTLI